MKTIASLFVLCGVTAVWIIAQTGVPVEPTNTAPSGACPNPAMQYVSPGGTIYTCQNGTWAQASGGGGTPGGSNTDIQYQKASAFAGSSNLIYYDTALSQPTTPTLSTHGTAGTTHYTYIYVANGLLGYSLPSAPATITTGNATLSGTNYVIVQTSAVTNSTSCDIFQFTAGNSPNGLSTYVGNVTCGNAYNDVGTTISTPPPYGAQPLAAKDASAGVSVVQNIAVSGLGSFGAIPLGTSVYDNGDTSGQATLSVGQTVTGPSTGPAVSDPVAMTVQQTITPASATSISTGQTWGLYLTQTVPSSNTYATGQMIDADFGSIANGSGASNGVYGIFSSAVMRGSVAGCAAFGGPCLIGGEFQANVSGTATVTSQAAGVNSQVYDFSSGTVAELDSIATTEYVSPGTVTLLQGLSIGAPSGGGTVTNYCGLCIADGHAYGSSSSYGLHVVGSSVISQFDGALQLPGLASATGTPNSLCINSNSVTVNAALTCTVSSARFKTRMEPIRSATTLLMRIVPESFAYRDDPQRTRLGFIAEQVASVDKKLGDGFDADGPRSIDQNAILALAVKTIQEQQAEIANLKRRITKLETEQK